MPHKKSHKKSKKQASRTMRGGFYGASGAIAPGAMEWSRGSEMGDWALSNRGANTFYGRGRKKRSASLRRRSSVKGGKKRAASVRRRASMRGGNRYGNSFGSYEGSGSRGLANLSTGTHKPENTAAFGKFNNYGAGPGQFDSFRGVSS
jgi:hypothetical protein